MGRLKGEAQTPQNKIPKTFWLQAQELLESGLLIKDAIRELRNRKIYFRMAIFGQLRALLDSGRKSYPPLLFRLASELSVPLEVYVEGRAELPIEIVDQPYIRVGLGRITIKQEFPTQKKMLLSDLLEQDYVSYKSGEGRTLIQVIKFFAENGGGAHYDKDVAEIDMVTFHHVPSLTILNDLVEVVIEAISKVISALCNLDIFYSLYLPSQEFSGKQCIFDRYIPDTTIRLQLMLAEGKPSLYITDYMAETFVVPIDEPLPLNSPLVLSVTIKTLQRLEGRILIRFGTSVVVDHIFEKAFLVPANPIYYHRTLNKGHGGAVGIYMNIGDIAEFKDFPDDKLLDMVNYCLNKPCSIEFRPDVYGESYPGETSIIFSEDHAIRPKIKGR